MHMRRHFQVVSSSLLILCPPLVRTLAHPHKLNTVLHLKEKLLHADPFSWIFPGPQILLPRSAGEQVNTSFLDLGNFSTTAINISSADSTLVLKVHYDIFTFISWMWRGVRTRFKNQPPFFRIVLKVCLHSVALIVCI